MAGLYDALMQGAQGFSNGAQSFGDQAKWAMGSYGNAPQPAPYAGGPDYPAKNDANAYVRNNWPSDGNHLMHATHPETFYTPDGKKIPPGGRGPTVGETIDGAPTLYQMLPFLMGLMKEHGGK